MRKCACIREGVKMPSTVLVGGQWGDEGKGKIVDLIAGDFDGVVRYSGGNNAGHTIVVGDKKYGLHHIPFPAISGALP